MKTHFGTSVHVFCTITVFALVFSAHLATAQQVVVPFSLTNAEGSGAGNGLPFDLAAHGLSSERYQQVYGNSQFFALHGPALLTQIAFRPDGSTGHAFSSTLPSIQINLSTTTTAGNDVMNTSFAANIGADEQIVFGPGPLSLSSAYSGPSGGPKDFDIVIDLTTPFLYNPASGNLLVDVRNFGGGSSTGMDQVFITSDSVNRLVTLSSDGVNLSTGRADTAGLVTRFRFVAIPEPSTFSLIIIGVINFLRNRRIKPVV